MKRFYVMIALLLFGASSYARANEFVVKSGCFYEYTISGVYSDVDSTNMNPIGICVEGLEL